MKQNTTSKVKHTPLPWNYHNSNNDDYLDIDSAGTRITSIFNVDKEAKANAEFIVTACNSHYELLEALKKAESSLESLQEADCFDKLDRKALNAVTAAIAKAANQ